MPEEDQQFVESQVLTWGCVPIFLNDKTCDAYCGGFSSEAMSYIERDL